MKEDNCKMKTLMHKTTVLTAATLALASAASAADVTVRPKATDEALINPDMGWVFYKYSNRLWAYGAGGGAEVPRHVRASQAGRLHACRLRRLVAGNARDRLAAR